VDIEAMDTEEAEDTEEAVDMVGAVEAVEAAAEEVEAAAADPAKNPAVNEFTSAQIFYAALKDIQILTYLLPMYSHHAMN
jgi:hypothetical protein